MSTWVKVFNSLPAHPKMLAANAGVPCNPGWLYVCGLCYSNEHLTDGFIPTHALTALAPGATKISSAMRRLVESGQWHEVDGGWRIHDYGEVQRSAEEIRDRRALDAERKAFVRNKSKRTPHGQVAESAESPSGVQAVDVESREQKTEKKEQHVEVRGLFDYWRSQCRHPDAKFTTDRRRKVEARITEGYTTDQIRLAIDGAARGAFVDAAGKRFDDIELICRNGSKLESFIERAKAKPLAAVPAARDLSIYDKAAGL